MSQLKLKNVAMAKHRLAGMSCVNFNSYTYNDLPHTARGIPFTKGTVGSILPFVGQLSLIAWIRIKNGKVGGGYLTLTDFFFVHHNRYFFFKTDSMVNSEKHA